MTIITILFLVVVLYAAGGAMLLPDLKILKRQIRSANPVMKIMKWVVPGWDTIQKRQCSINGINCTVVKMFL